MPGKLNRKSANVLAKHPVKVLQFGDGNFLRGFADWIIDIMNEKTDFNGDVIIVAPLRKGRIQTDDQDGLFHVVLNGLYNGAVLSESRLIKVVQRYIDPYNEYNTFLTTAADSNIKFLISNSTEAGIVFDPTDVSASTPPQSFPAKVTQWLLHRFEHFKGAAESGINFLPCELVQDNGDRLRDIVLQYADLWSLSVSFKDWLNNHNIFCNTLVDRIVTGFSNEGSVAVKQQTGFDDARMVAAEPYYLWVIESRGTIEAQFPATEAGLEVKFVADLTPYRTRKVRILNGAHTSMMAVAYLKGFRTVREAIEDPTMFSFLDQAIRKEVIPTLPLPADELQQFADEVFERFRNPHINHALASIALNSISKFRVRVLPSIVEFQMITGRLPANLIQSFAALILFYRGSWQGEETPVKDDEKIMSFMKQAWDQTDTALMVDAILSNTTLWGEDLTRIDGFPRSVVKNIELLMK